MKRILFVFFSLIYAGALFAQNYSAHGIVVDDTNKPLALVTVQAKQSGSYTRTDQNGDFTIPLDSWIDTLVLKHTGYVPLAIVVTSHDSDLKRYVMSPDSFNFSPVLLPDVTSPMSFPATISCEDAANVQTYRDIPYVVEHAPSVVSTSKSGIGFGYTSFRVRGIDMSHMNVTLDGIPLNNSETGEVDFVDLGDISSSIHRVIINPGVGSSQHGVSPMGAAVSLDTKRVSEKSYACVSGAVGSYGTKKLAVEAATGRLESGLAVDARFTTAQSQGWIDRSRCKLTSVDLTAQYTKNNHELTAKILSGWHTIGGHVSGVTSSMYEIDPTYNSVGRYLDDEGNEKFYSNELDSYHQSRYSLSYRYTFSSNAHAYCTLFATRGDGYYEHYSDDADIANYGFESEYKDVVSQQQREHWFYGYLTGLAIEKNSHEFELGHSLHYYDGAYTGSVLWVQDKPELDLSKPYYHTTGNKLHGTVFTKYTYHVTPKLLGYLDAQFRLVHYTMAGVDLMNRNIDNTYDWQFIDPKIGLKYSLNHSQDIIMSFAMAQREPNRNQLIATMNSGDLKSETIYDSELGYHKRWDKLFVGCGAYYMAYQNQILPTDLSHSDESYSYKNVPRSSRFGLEALFEYRPVKEIEWGGEISISKSTIKEYVTSVCDYDADGTIRTQDIDLGTTDMSFSPNIIASHRIIVYPTQGLSLGIVSKIVGKQYIDNTSNQDRRLDSYAVHDFIARYLWYTGDGNSFDIQFMIHNLLDTIYISDASCGYYMEGGVEKTWKNYFPQAGIHYSLKVAFKF